jgi:hypothetical protein
MVREYNLVEVVEILETYFGCHRHLRVACNIYHRHPYFGSLVVHVVFAIVGAVVVLV